MVKSREEEQFGLPEIRKYCSQFTTSSFSDHYITAANSPQTDDHWWTAIKRYFTNLTIRLTSLSMDFLSANLLIHYCKIGLKAEFQVKMSLFIDEFHICGPK